MVCLDLVIAITTNKEARFRRSVFYKLGDERQGFDIGPLKVVEQDHGRMRRRRYCSDKSLETTEKEVVSLLVVDGSE